MRPQYLVVGHGPALDRREGAVDILRSLGAATSTLDLEDEPRGGMMAPSAIVVEGLERPDIAAMVLRRLRKTEALASVPALLVVSSAQVGQVDGRMGFDDFVLYPFVPAELYARLRRLEWQAADYCGEEALKVGTVEVQLGAHEAYCGGAAISLTSKEYALLVYMMERPERLVTRSEVLDRVWGEDYEGGARTIDVHVRRLRAKFGTHLKLVTVHGEGYRLDRN